MEALRDEALAHGVLDIWVNNAGAAGVYGPTASTAVTAPDGALRAAVRARDEGLAGGLGITGHTHDAPRVHLEGLRRFDFDTVLTPLNHRLWRACSRPRRPGPRSGCRTPTPCSPPCRPRTTPPSSPPSPGGR